MNSFIPAKFAAAAALAVVAFGAATAAHARSDVYFSIGVQAPGVYMEPVPVYVQPRPVYVEPRPVYVAPRPVYAQPPVYVAPAEMYERRGLPAYDSVYEEEQAWRRAEWRRRHWRHHHHDWDQYESHGRNWD